MVLFDFFQSQMRKPSLKRRHEWPRVTCVQWLSWDKNIVMPPMLFFHCTVLILRPVSDRKMANK